MEGQERKGIQFNINEFMDMCANMSAVTLKIQLFFQNVLMCYFPKQ